MEHVRLIDQFLRSKSEAADASVESKGRSRGEDRKAAAPPGGSFAAAAPPAAVQLRVCIDADMSYRPLGLHLGAHRSAAHRGGSLCVVVLRFGALSVMPCRSPVRSLADFVAVFKAIQTVPGLQLSGVMGYEVC